MLRFYGKGEGSKGEGSKKYLIPSRILPCHSERSVKRSYSEERASESGQMLHYTEPALERSEGLRSA